MAEGKVEIQIKHPYNGFSHWGPRASTKCCGVSVSLGHDGKTLVFKGVHSQGVGGSIGLVLDSNKIDELIDKLMKMRDDIIIANL